MIAVLSASVAVAAVVVESGTDPKFWPKHAVVVGRIISIKEGRLGTTIRLQVLAVVATDLLVPVDLTLTDVPLGAPECGLLVEVRVGMLAAVCLERVGTGWSVSGNGLAFFPTGKGIVPISGLDDPVLGEVVRKVADARKRSREQPH